MDSLTLEVVTFNILTRVPLDTLGKCRATCKDWNEQTQGSEFKESRQRKVKDFQGYILQNNQGALNKKVEFISSENDESSGELHMKFLPKSGTVEAVDQGICYYLPWDYYQEGVLNHYVCKPTTEQYREIPKPRGESGYIALKVIKTHPLHFKILRISDISPVFTRPHGKQYSNFKKVEIFDSNSWTWARVKRVKIPHNESLLTESVSVKGAFYWVTSQKRIFSYQLDQEIGKFINFPASVRDDIYGFSDFSITKYQGQLALSADSDVQDMQVWIYEDEWTMKDMWIAGQYMYPEIIGFTAENTIVTYNPQEMTFYNMEEGSTRTVERKVNWGHANVYPFVTDNVPVELLE